MLVPLMLPNRTDWLQHGPMGWEWLAPTHFLGLSSWSALSRGMGASLAIAILTTVTAAAWLPVRRKPVDASFDVQALRQAARRFIPAKRLDALLQDAPAQGPVAAALVGQLEHDLRAVLGSASTRLLLDSARRDSTSHLDTVAAIVDQATQGLRFNQRVLEAALENMTQGISVTDGHMRLMAWNARYAALFDYPDELLQVGRPIADLLRHNLQRGLLPPTDVDRELSKRLRHMQAATPYVSQRRFPDGTIVEIRGNPMPGGGFVATFTDVTAFREAVQALERSNETLEQRVGERNASLETARREAEQANDAKSRFLAAVGHDLLQPLHAAHLFTDALARQAGDDASRERIGQLRGALDSTTDLLAGLLDLSRLEAGGLVPESRTFPAAEVLDPLASEFGVLAAERGLRFRYRPTRAWTHADPQLLRRVLQNFLANAVRYTERGSVLLGVRRIDGGLRVDVFDTGPGIPASAQKRMFEEFRRGDDARGQGLGLGLSIAERIADLLQAPISLHSRVGQGTPFGLGIPLHTAPDDAAWHRPAATRSGQARVLLVDNDPQALAALQGVLEGWAHVVDGVGDGDAAAACLARQAADIWIFDYHLDDGDTGLAVHARLCRRFAARPTLIVSADADAQVRQAVSDAGLSLLGKPLKPLALKSVLDRLLAARRYQSPSN